MKLRRILQVAFVLALSGIIFSASVLAQERTVGVNIGNFFRYADITSNWSSNDPNSTIPPAWEEYNEMEWYYAFVEDVSGTNITFQTVQRFKNGTEKEGGYIDIDTGDGNMVMFAISANLEANDTIYASGINSNLQINETVVRTYQEGVRNTNHLNQTGELSGTWNQIDYYYYYSVNHYWDKPTGIQVELNVEVINQTGQYLSTWSMAARITESNVWVIPEFPTWASILLVFIVLTVSIAIYKRRLLKTPIR